MIFFAVFLAASFVFTGRALALSNESSARDLQIHADNAAASGRYDEVRKLYLRELDSLLAKGQLAAAGLVYSELGEITQIHGLFPAAEAYYKKGLELLKRNAPPNDLRLVGAMDDLGWLYTTWGRLPDGSRLMDEAENRASRAQPSDPGLIRHLDAQAAYLMVTGRYTEAQRDWNRALQIGQLNYGLDSPIYDTVLMHSGQAHALYGDYDTAAEMFRQFLTIEDRVSVRPTPTRSAAAAELAHIYTQLHKFSDARPWFDQALVPFQNNPDEAPLVHSMVLTYLGDFYMGQRDYNNAQLQYREALNLQQRVLGKNNAVAASMISLSKALKKLHLKDQARQLVAQAKAIVLAERIRLQEGTVDVLRFASNRALTNCFL